MRSITRAVWTAWLAEPTPSMWSGAGTPSSSQEDVRHQPVVVLAGVDQRVATVRHPPAQLGDDRRHLDEVRPRADHVGDPHGAARVAAWANARRRGFALCGAAVFGGISETPSNGPVKTFSAGTAFCRRFGEQRRLFACDTSNEQPG